MRTVRTIRNYRIRMKVVCPKTWDAVAETTDPTIRRCSACSEQVYLCTTDEETLMHARANHCIARAVPHHRLRRLFEDREMKLTIFLEEYAKHTALNFGQVMQGVRYFYSHPDCDEAAARGTFKHCFLSVS